MYLGGYTAEITSLSPKAIEKDVHDFFSHTVVKLSMLNLSDMGNMHVQLM